MNQPKMLYGKSLTEVSDGYLTLKHYKEPLRAIPKNQGYGYYGAVLGSLDGKYMQCHICGNLYSQVIAHARQAHQITNKEYRERFMLAGSTALVSEDMRAELKQRTLDFFNSLTPERKEEIKMKARLGFLKWRKSATQDELTETFSHPQKLETKNKRGICPDQLLQKIKEVKERIGHVPTLREFIIETGGQRYKHLIFQTFGSWNKAIQMLGMTPNARYQYPKSHQPRKKYDREELLEYLRIFAQENRTVPTSTDSKRGWIPDLNVYRRHFGSLENARREAGVYEYLEGAVIPHRWASKKPRTLNQG
jgi:hypothetical protein